MVLSMFEQYSHRKQPKSIWNSLDNFWHNLTDNTAALVTLLLPVGFIVILVFYSISPPGIAPADFSRLMRQEGITQVQPVDVTLFSCGHGDGFATGFRGVKNGQSVQGVVCGGFFKSNTIRYD